MPPNAPINAAPAAAGAPAGGHDHAGGQHIVAMGVCGDVGGYNGSPKMPLQVPQIVKGQPWKIQAYYDYKQFNGMKNNRGGMDTVMGIAIMFVRTKNPNRITDAGKAPANTQPKGAASKSAAVAGAAAPKALPARAVPAGAVPKSMFASEFDDAGLSGEYR